MPPDAKPRVGRVGSGACGTRRCRGTRSAGALLTEPVLMFFTGAETKTSMSSTDGRGDCCALVGGAPICGQCRLLEPQSRCPPLPRPGQRRPSPANNHQERLLLTFVMVGTPALGQSRPAPLDPLRVCPCVQCHSSRVCVVRRRNMPDPRVRETPQRLRSPQAYGRTDGKHALVRRDHQLATREPSGEQAPLLGRVHGGKLSVAGGDGRVLGHTKGQ
jgi:hypothetical protein